MSYPFGCLKSFLLPPETHDPCTQYFPTLHLCQIVREHEIRWLQLVGLKAADTGKGPQVTGLSLKNLGWCCSAPLYPNPCPISIRPRRQEGWMPSQWVQPRFSGALYSRTGWLRHLTCTPSVVFPVLILQSMLIVLPQLHITIIWGRVLFVSFFVFKARALTPNQFIWNLRRGAKT